MVRFWPSSSAGCASLPTGSSAMSRPPGPRSTHTLPTFCSGPRSSLRSALSLSTDSTTPATRSRPSSIALALAGLAVVWSGLFNILGVLLSSGAVAFGVVSLLPGRADSASRLVGWICHGVRDSLSPQSFGTWEPGGWGCRPRVRIHLIGSIIGVGVANALTNGRAATAGVDWSQASAVGYALLLSPLAGFIGSALLLLAMKLLVRKPELYSAPAGDAPPPLWIRAITS